jgi:hypothetical protein
MAAQRTDAGLRIEKIFEITNASNPPKTITGKPFTIFIPKDHTDINALYVTELGIPLNQTPVPTETEGIYSVDYPLRPGVSRLALSFDVPYDNAVYDYEEILQYGIQSCAILVKDPSLEVSSETVVFDKDPDFHGFFAYTASSLPPSSVLSVRFSGGRSSTSKPSEPKTRVFPRASIPRKATATLTVLLSLSLLALALFYTRSASTVDVKAEHIKPAYEKLLSQIAKLDDLHAAGAVADTLYFEKRSQLKNQLAQLLQRSNHLKNHSSRSSKKSKKGKK